METTNADYFYTAQSTPEKRPSDGKNGDHFIIEDLLDFPIDNLVSVVDAGLMAVSSTDSSTVTAVDTSCNSSFSAVSTAEPHFHPAVIGGGPRCSVGANFSSELCVPYDDLAELEWLSNFVEESFSSEDLQKLQLIQGMKARTDEVSAIHQYHFQPETTHPGPLLPPETPVPAKARSKRSRTAPGNWTSRLLVVSPTPPANVVPAMSSSSESDITAVKKAAKPGVQKKREGPETASPGGRGGSASIAPPTRRRSGGQGPWARRPCAMRAA
ncbi:UNVERIFIED_CONTAM: GATA transcription factor 9 [Sesamum latifolium]|uniref:GATA transcription factor 9 n=1 Tax=Sesamum latifolium TaxID=2727402 RepID=A0AAW2X106_9LAMI